MGGWSVPPEQSCKYCNADDLKDSEFAEGFVPSLLEASIEKYTELHPPACTPLILLLLCKVTIVHIQYYQHKKMKITNNLRE